MYYEADQRQNLPGKLSTCDWDRKLAVSSSIVYVSTGFTNLAFIIRIRDICC